MTGFVLLVLLLGAVGVVSAAFLYQRAEPRVRGRGALLVLRLAAFALLALLLVNPSLPGEDPVTARAATAPYWVLVDPDPALGAADATGAPLWTRALERTRSAADAGARVARVSGGAAEGLDPSVLEGQGPAPLAERPGEALLRLAESGADSILLLSPLRRPPEALEAALARIPVPVRVERIGEEVLNAAVAELEIPARVPAGEAVEASVLLVGEGGEPGDSVRLVVTAGGVPVAERTVPLPDAGVPARVALTLPPPPGTGEVRYTASASLEGDAFSADDERVRIVRVGPPEGGVLVVSVLPDWEPRTLLPVLERATGLEGEGYLRMADGRFLPLVAGGAPLTPLPAEELVRRVGLASLLVLHGVSAALSGPLEQAVQRHPRVLHLPAGPPGAALAGVPTGPARPGEWTPDPDVPPSPVSGFLAGRALAGLPPLSSVLVPEPPARGIVALRLRRPGVGAASSGVLLVQAPEGRRAVALASGFWRWGARDGEPREAYRNLWAGVAGWLLAHEAVAGEPGAIRPAQPVLARDHPMAWEAPGLIGARVEVEVRPGDADPDGPYLRRDEATVGPDGRFSLPPLPPGRYTFRARALTAPADPGAHPDPDPGSGPEPDRETETDAERTIGPAPPQAPGPAEAVRSVDAPPPAQATPSAEAAPSAQAGPSAQAADPATGAFEVETFQDALLLPPGDAEALNRIAGTEAPPDLRAEAGRPLRSHPLPWLLLLGLLCVEWVGRRRAGLQ